MKKTFKSLISTLLVLAIVCSVVPVAFAADSYGLAWVNLKSQANGMIYMDNHVEAVNTPASVITSADFLPSPSGSRSNLLALLTGDVWILENVVFDDQPVTFAAPAKRKVSTDYSDKETIVLQPGGNKTVTVPGGYYKEFYLAAFSVVTDAQNAALSLKINYADGSETISQPVYDYKTDYTSLDSAIKLQDKKAHAIVATTWGMANCYQENNRTIYAYKIAVDETKLLKNIEVTATGCATAFLGLTGNMNISKTKAYAEELLAGSEASVEANESEIKATIAALENTGVERSEIAGIEKLDAVQTTLVKVDVNAQANGIIYMDGYSEFTGLANAGYKKESDYGVVVDAAGCWHMMRTSDRALLSSVNFNGTAIPFDIAEKRAVSDDLTDKEAIIIKASGATKTTTVEIPDGFYKDIYFAAMSAATSDNAKADIKLNYNGSEETVAQPIYGYNKTYTELSNAVKISSTGGRFEMPTWTWSSYGGNNAYYVYKISADNSKLLKNITITATDNTTAILGMTGVMHQYKTKSYLENALAGSEDVIEENYDSLSDIVATLEKMGFARSDIAGIENLKISKKALVKVDVKAQANGIIYMDSAAESQKLAVSAYGKNDFVNAGGALGGEWQAIYTPNRAMLSSVNFGGVTIPFDIAEKRAVSEDVADKEAIIIKSAWDTKTTTVEIPDGFYKDIYFAAMSSVANTDAKADIKLNYNGSEETITQSIYGYNKTYESLSNAVAITNGIRIEMLSWNAANGWGNYPQQDVEYYVYKISADKAKLLKNITITATDNATAILGITGNVYVDKTEEYLENVLAGSEDEIEANYDSLNEMVTTLEKAGVDRSDIAGIDNLKISKKAFVKVDVNAQANSIIYMDSHSEFTGLASAGFKKESDYGVVIAAAGCWHMMRTSDRAMLSSVNFNGAAIPFDVAEKRAVSSDLTDKEAIIIKSAGDTKTTTVEIPDGYYKDIYFAAMSATTSDNAKADIKLNYNGSEETIAQPIYDYNKTYENPSNAVKISSNGGRFEMPTWTWSAYSGNNAYYVYKISADKAKLLKNITITATDNVTAILGITGNLYVDETKAYAEVEIAAGDFTKAEIKDIENVVESLILAGVNKSEIKGIANLEAEALKLFGAMEITNAVYAVSGTTVNFSSVLKNIYGADGEEYTVIAGLYVKGENKLADVKPVSGTLGAGKSTDISGMFENVDTTKAYEIKYIVVKSGLEPLTTDVVKTDVTF